MHTRNATRGFRFSRRVHHRTQTDARLSQLTISIPAYNDAETIRAVVEESLAAAGQCATDIEVLVINDGSRDGTQQAIEAICRDYPRVRAIEHPRNLGFGPTIREAYLAASSEWVVFLPGDGQIPPTEVPVLWRERDDCDLVLAWRRERNDPINRRFTSWCYNRMVSSVAGRRIRDVNGTALVRRALLDQFSLESDSAFIHAELALKCIRHGARWREVAIAHRPRMFGEGSGNRLGVVAKTFRDLVKYAATGRVAAARGHAIE